MGPAINLLAIILTARVFGPRIWASPVPLIALLYATVIGLVMLSTLTGMINGCDYIPEEPSSEWI